MRCQDWPEKLDKFIKDNIHKPFVYAENDCCIFAAEAIRIMTGKDIMEDIRGKYDGKESGYKFIKRFAEDLVGTVRKVMEKHNFKEIPPLTAQRGDVVIYETNFGDTVGICLGEKIVTPGNDGIISNSVLEGRTAWRIE